MAGPAGVALGPSPSDRDLPYRTQLVPVRALHASRARDVGLARAPLSNLVEATLHPRQVARLGGSGSPALSRFDKLVTLVLEIDGGSPMWGGVVRVNPAMHLPLLQTLVIGSAVAARADAHSGGGSSSSGTGPEDDDDDLDEDDFDDDDVDLDGYSHHRRHRGGLDDEQRIYYRGGSKSDDDDDSVDDIDGPAAAPSMSRQQHPRRSGRHGGDGGHVRYHGTATRRLPRIEPGAAFLEWVTALPSLWRFVARSPLAVVLPARARRARLTLTLAHPGSATVWADIARSVAVRGRSPAAVIIKLPRRTPLPPAMTIGDAAVLSSGVIDLVTVVCALAPLGGRDPAVRWSVVPDDGHPVLTTMASPTSAPPSPPKHRPNGVVAAAERLERKQQQRQRHSSASTAAPVAAEA
ncbi:hypothetical protein BC828DRAFT_386884 [Blastocladiella britannica]|nr:hypothetical protein BC828DRAFT_386884 [Blastocladiella britannica]